MDHSIRYNVLDSQYKSIETPLNPFFWKQYFEKSVFPWFPKTETFGDMDAAQHKAFGTISWKFRTLPFYNVDAQPFTTPLKNKFSSYFMTNFYKGKKPISVDIYELSKIAGISLSFEANLFLNFSTSEHIFQFAKAMMLMDCNEWESQFYQHFDGKTCSEVFKHSQLLDKSNPGVLVQRGWIKFNSAVMFYALQKKFENADLQKLLLCTSNRILVEDSEKDRFWGCGKDGYGENKLGQMLMFLRKNISHEHYAPAGCDGFRHSEWKHFTCEYCDFHFNPVQPDHRAHDCFDRNFSSR